MRQSYPRWSFAARRPDELDRAHGAFTASRAPADIDVGEPEQRLLPRFCLSFGLLRGAGEQLPCPVEFLPATSIAEYPVMPDLDEPVGQNVKEEPPDELVRLDRHDFLFVVIRVIPPAERDFVVLELYQPVIADRDPVCVSAEVLQNVFGLFERRLAVDDPLLLVQIGDQGIETPRRRKMTYGAGVNKFVLGTELFQISDKLPPKEFRHDLDREEKVIFARLPFAAVTRQAPAGDDSVDMRMVHLVLSPRVQDRDMPYLRAEVFRGFRKLTQGFRNDFEQKPV